MFMILMNLYFLRLPKTPAVRLPRHNERVYSFSANGSPIAPEKGDVIINVPSDNGEVRGFRCLECVCIYENIY